MHTLLANSLNELDKLKVKKVTKLFFIAAALFPFLVKLLAAKLFLTEWMALPAENINYSVVDLFTVIILPFYCFIAAASLFAAEAEKGTLFPVRPISRFELFASKTAAVGLMMGLQLLIVCLSLVISDVLIDRPFQLTDAFTTLGACLASWLVLLVLSGAAILLALVMNSSITAISSMVLLYLLMLFLPYLVPESLYLFPTAYLDWYMQWLGNVSIQRILQTVTYLCSSFVLFFTTGCYIFNRKEA